MTEMLQGMAPLVMEKQNLAVWSQNRWQYFNVDYIEPIPASTQTIVNFGAVNAVSTIAQTDVTTFDVDEHQLIQLRWYPLDDVEAILWLTRSQGKFATRGMQSRVSHASRAFDPLLATTEFNILGRDRDAFIEIRNLSAFNYGAARVQFWGYKYILTPLINIFESVDDTGILRPYIRQSNGNVVPLMCRFTNAEGRLA